MSWAVIGPAIQEIVQAVDLSDGSPLGQVHLGDVHLARDDRFAELFTVPDGSGRDRLRGIRIARTSIEERWFSSTRTLARERYVLRLVEGLTKTVTDPALGAVDSARAFQAYVNDVRAPFREAIRIADGTDLVCEAPEVPQIEYLMYGSKLCHYAEINLVATVMETIGDVDQPAAAANAGDARAPYADAADQLAAYLSMLENFGVVRTERPDVTKAGPDGNDVVDLDHRATLLSESVSAGDARAQLRLWLLFRNADRETRGIANRVEGRATWSVHRFWPWLDVVESYTAFQNDIDEARALLRGVGNLGNVDNPTQVLSSPLQFRELGARMYADVLCHFGTGTIEVEEVVHA